MEIENHQYTPSTIFMGVLLIFVATASACGNGFVLGILARFKTLRTFPNILIANLALVDFLTGVINMPMYLLWGVFKVKWFTGKTLAIFVAFAGSFSTFIGKTSMLVLLVNAFLAITFDLKYYIWKTNDKAIAIVAAEWLIGLLTIVSLISLQLYDIDLGDVPLLEYNHVYIAKNLPFMATSMNLFIVSSVVFGFLMLWSVRKRIRLRKRLNLPQLQEKARLQIDIQAAKTVLITVGVFLLCNVPPPLIVALAGQFFKDTEWPRFLAMFSISISSAINPVLYCFRNRRFRSALKQFLKDPCGNSPFKETKKVQNEAVKTTSNKSEQARLDCERVQDCGNQNNENGDQLMTLRKSLSSQEPGSKRPVKSAWLGCKHSPSKGTDDGGDDSREGVDYTINEVTVEVHLNPNLKSSNHNFIKVHPETKSQSEEKPYPKNTEDYSRKDVIETSF